MLPTFGEILPHIAWRLLILAPPDRRKRVERYLRGREEFAKLKRADCAVVSFGKSGRTWLRLMLSRFYQVKFGLSEHSFLQFDNFHAINSNIPKLLFTHGNYMRDYTGDWESKSVFYSKKVILMVRDPRDVAVSQYFQWKFRMKDRKKIINDYPINNKEISPYDFVMKEEAGLKRVIDFYNGWLQEHEKLRDLLIVRYEDLRKAPADYLGKILVFLETPATEAEIANAVDFAAFDNMKKLEAERRFWRSGRRMLPGDAKNPDSFKVRRAKVGGYREYFDQEEVAEIDKTLTETLLPGFGY